MESRKKSGPKREFYESLTFRKGLKGMRLVDVKKIVNVEKRLKDRALGHAKISLCNREEVGEDQQRRLRINSLVIKVENRNKIIN